MKTIIDGRAKNIDKKCSHQQYVDIKPSRAQMSKNDSFKKIFLLMYS